MFQDLVAAFHENQEVTEKFRQRHASQPVMIANDICCELLFISFLIFINAINCIVEIIRLGK